MSGVLHGILAGLAGAAKDAFFNYVTLLLPGNGTNGAQNNTFIDSSTNNFTITRNGNTTQGTFTPFGSNWSNYFDGTGDRLSLATATAFGNSSNTVEFWFYPTDSAVTYRGIYDSRSTTGTDTGYGIFQYGLTIEVYGNGLKVATAAAAFSVNTWTHVALVRNSGTCQLYINGVASGASATYSSNLTSTVRVIGDSVNTAFPFVGYVSNLREVTSAVYTANFTPPTAPLTAITNTSLLTCQSNRFVDNSTNAFTVTPNGDVSVQRFSPFSPTDAYSTSVVGGSGYFDETNDYLTVPVSANMSPGTGDFTIECWVRFAVSTVGNGQGIYQLSNGYLNSAVRGPALGTDNTVGDWAIYYGTAAVQSGTVPTAGVWYHTALVRSSTTTKLYVDGTSIISVTDTTNYTDQYFVVGGWYSTGFLLNGYISNLRVVKGTAVYTANFTPPTSPLTAITNTQLLLNFTNAGIIDNAMLNDLETVGNAQISTAQSKFGGSSIAFDGTGDWLAIPSTQNFTFGTGDFTVEFWMRTANNGNIMNPAGATGTGYWGLLIQSGGMRWNSAYGVTNLWEVTATSIQDNNWHHVAIARASGVTKVFFDGVSQAAASGTFTDSTNYSGVDGWKIGSGNLADFNGYIDDFRITKGVARYTADFTPPAQAFPTS